jgi:S-DNA-T family DNA segregation ATPase FtsK/SpoIIIE
VVTDPRKAANALRWAVVEMERRYQLFAETGARNLEMYMQSLADEPEREPLPYIVVIIDELADLMMVAAAEVEDAICRLAQMARAAGVYLIIATQRPSVDVITGLIKANVPSRISYAVSSQVDSRTILDMGGAERLIGKGDMLYYPIGAAKPTRAQGAWISDKEVEALVSWWKKQGEPEYEEVMDEVLNGSAFEEDEYEDDELLPDAIRLVVENGQASISMLQRRFRIGYSRAARLIDVMEVRGIVGSYQGSKPREVLVDSTIFEEG